MLFEGSRPVFGPEFLNRKAELDRLAGTVTALRKGATRYVAVLGPRKMGKTSLLRELIRRSQAPGVACLLIDCWEKKATPHAFFREYLACVLDSFVAQAAHSAVTRSLKASLAVPAELTMCMAEFRGLGLKAVDAACEALLQIESGNLSDSVLTRVQDSPEQLAAETGVRFVVVIDEFQELKDLNLFPAIRDGVGDIFAFFRARWQTHAHVNYLLSGSQPTVMREILTAQRAPFFQHFDIMTLGPFERREALHLLRSRSEGEQRPIPRDICESILDTVGTCPFYLQIIGAELCRMPAIDQGAFKVALQRVLFDADGRLHLYFSNLVSKIVGRSASIERTLIALAARPGRLSDVAGRLGVAAGTLKSWIDRCRDLVEVENAVYRINDPCLALWLRAKSDEGAVLPAVVLGNEAEKRVARQMASAGFELVFQSRASRGAFDLLAVRGSVEVGVQVKKASRPFYLSKDELGRMKHWSKRLGWLPVLAIVEEDEVLFYNVAARRPSGKGCRFDARTPRIENLLDVGL
jgi:AAA+ ATPase superfamily predicted ATPase/Holliday junction resolvase